ncbi:MAG: hypothetical protein AABW71_03395 [Nanoarchaeota archaeon]
MNNKRVKGIEGWLLWITIIFFISGALWGLSFIIWLFNLFFETDYVSIWYLFESGLMLFLYVQTIVFEMKKKKKFIIWAKKTLLISIIITLIEIWIEPSSYMVGSIAGTIIWIWYFNVSVRVKNTFVKS